MFVELAINFLQILHVVAIGAGLASGMLVAMLLLRRCDAPVELKTLLSLQKIHGAVLFAIAGLWVTGLASLGIQHLSGLDMSSMHFLKVETMLILSASSILLCRFAPLILREYRWLPIYKISMRNQLALVMLAWLSASGWTSALALSFAEVTRDVTLAQAATLMAAIYITGLTGALLALLIANKDRFGTRPQKVQAAVASASPRPRFRRASEDRINARIEALNE